MTAQAWLDLLDNPAFAVLCYVVAFLMMWYNLALETDEEPAWGFALALVLCCALGGLRWLAMGGSVGEGGLFAIALAAVSAVTMRRQNRHGARRGRGGER